MIINHYTEGQTVNLSARFSARGVLTDPTTITLKVKKPDSTLLTYTYALGEVFKDEVGVYNRSVKADLPGLWFYRWIGTGAVEAVGEHKFDVKASQIE